MKNVGQWDMVRKWARRNQVARGHQFLRFLISRRRIIVFMNRLAAPIIVPLSFLIPILSLAGVAGLARVLLVPYVIGWVLYGLQSYLVMTYRCPNCSEKVTYFRPRWMHLSSGLNYQVPSVCLSCGHALGGPPLRWEVENSPSQASRTSDQERHGAGPSVGNTQGSGKGLSPRQRVAFWLLLPPLSIVLVMPVIVLMPSLNGTWVVSLINAMLPLLVIFGWLVAFSVSCPKCHLPLHRGFRGFGYLFRLWKACPRCSESWTKPG